MGEEYEKYSEMAVRGTLPKGFNKWESTFDCSDWTLAHLAAMYGTLPEDFDQWALANIHGWTVAHQGKKQYWIWQEKQRQSAIADALADATPMQNQQDMM
jgi:hypothetical protein